MSELDELDALMEGLDDFAFDLGPDAVDTEAQEAEENEKAEKKKKEKAEKEKKEKKEKEKKEKKEKEQKEKEQKEKEQKEKEQKDKEQAERDAEDAEREKAEKAKKEKAAPPKPSRRGTNAKGSKPLPEPQPKKEEEDTTQSSLNALMSELDAQDTSSSRKSSGGKKDTSGASALDALMAELDAPRQSVSRTKKTPTRTSDDADSELAALMAELDGAGGQSDDPAPAQKKTESPPPPQKAPKPVPTKEPKPAPKKEPKPAPKKELKPAPKKEPKPAPEKEPKPAPKKEPKPAPKKEPKPAPKKVPKPAPEKEVSPEPEEEQEPLDPKERPFSVAIRIEAPPPLGALVPGAEETLRPLAPEKPAPQMMTRAEREAEVERREAEREKQKKEDKEKELRTKQEQKERESRGKKEKEREKKEKKEKEEKEKKEKKEKEEREKKEKKEKEEREKKEKKEKEEKEKKEKKEKKKKPEPPKKEVLKAVPTQQNRSDVVLDEGVSGLELLQVHIPPTSVMIPKFDIVSTDDGKPFATYCLQIACGGVVWRLYRRYTEFSTLHTELTRSYRDICIHANFPGKLVMKRDAEGQAKKRLQPLEKYLQWVCDTKRLYDDVATKNFLGITSHIAEIHAKKQADDATKKNKLAVSNNPEVVDLLEFVALKTGRDVDNLERAFNDGVLLCELVSVLADVELKYNSAPKGSRDMLKNICVARERLEDCGVDVSRWGEQDVMSGSRKPLIRMLKSLQQHDFSVKHVPRAAPPPATPSADTKASTKLDVGPPPAAAPTSVKKEKRAETRDRGTRHDWARGSKEEGSGLLEWANMALHGTNKRIADLDRGIQSGVEVCFLTQVVCTCEINFKRSPDGTRERLANFVAARTAMEKASVKVSDWTPQDISSGSRKAVQRMLRNLFEFDFDGPSVKKTRRNTGMPPRKPKPERQATASEIPEKKEEEEGAPPQKAPKPAPKKEPKPAPKKEPKPAPKKEPKPAPKKEPKPAPKKEPKPAPKKEPKPAPKKEPKPAPKKEPSAPEAAPETEAKPAPAPAPAKKEPNPVQLAKIEKLKPVVSAWINTILIERGSTRLVDDVTTDCMDGVVPLLLLGYLSGRDIPIQYPEAKDREERERNVHVVELVLRAVKLNIPEFSIQDFIDGDDIVVVTSMAKIVQQLKKS